MRILRNCKENRKNGEYRQHSLLYFEAKVLNNFDDPIRENIRRFAS